MRVQATERPEEAWAIDPLERGSLVHRILERFFRELQVLGRLDGLGAYSSADHQLLEEIAESCFAELELRGVTGHPLVWENTSAAIRVDLRTFLVKDERWRGEEGLTPTFFEQPFGIQKDPRSWPALALRVAGIDVTFRGYIDRIDADPTRRRAFLYDYKTGGTSSYGGMNKDPLMAGKHIQLSLYRRAVLASIPDLQEVEGAFWFVSSRGGFKMLPSEPPPYDPTTGSTKCFSGLQRGFSAACSHKSPATRRLALASSVGTTACTARSSASARPAVMRSLSANRVRLAT